MNDNSGKIRSVMKITFKLQKDTHFICKIPFLKNFGIQLSRRLKNYIPEICQNVQKVDYQGAEGKSICQIFNLSWALVLINVNVGFQTVPRNDSKIQVRWKSKTRFERYSGILQLVQATNNLKIPIKCSFWFQFMLLVISCAFFNKQTKGIIHSNHSSQKVVSDKQ